MNFNLSMAALRNYLPGLQAQQKSRRLEDEDLDDENGLGGQKINKAVVLSEVVNHIR